MLGRPATASSRLTFAQAFNSLGTTVFPYVGSLLILRSLATADPAQLSGAALDAFRTAESHVVATTYVGLASALAIVAAVVYGRRHRLPDHYPETGSILHAFDLLRRPRFGFGALCIFLYVGAEVAIGSLIVSFLMQPDVLGMGSLAAGEHVPYYWGGAMLGRFVGAYLLSVVSPGKVLAAAAGGVIALLLVAGTSAGPVGGWALLAIGLGNSIMFPTIFTLASEGLGTRAPEGSGILCVAIVGGAIVPLVTGRAADLVGLRAALAIPALCYAGILLFGLYARRPLTVGTAAARAGVA
jgi:FHS family L-fucose permease-like MFS transporter